MSPTFAERLCASLLAAPLESVKLLVSVLGLLGLLGIIATLISMRVSVCNQIYSRWQSLVFKFGDTEGAYQALVSTRYVKGAADRPPGHSIAVGYLNLFEEAFRYRNSRVLVFWHLLPSSFWMSIKNSMRKQFQQYPYLRSFWEAETTSWSEDFNELVRREIL